MPKLHDDESEQKPDIRLADGEASSRIGGVHKTLQQGKESPSGRLAVTDDGMPSKESRYPQALGSPAVRLAFGNSPPERNGTSGLESPTVRRVGQTDGGINTSVFPKAFAQAENSPALLVSFFYIEPFLVNKSRYSYRDWALDSGAFSAHNSGAEINLQEYIDCCKRLMEEDPTLVEIFALDVIGDSKASLRNTEEMWRQGIPAIPTFHHGEPWSYLKGIAKDYPKIALGGCVGKRNKDKFAGQCFARVWPKKIHGFGFGSEKSIMSLPFHSVDATNWELGPCKFGRWASFGAIGTANISVRGSRQNLRAEVEFYLELERKARELWKKEMAKLEAEPTGRLAVGCSEMKRVGGFIDKALAVRLTAIPKQGTQEESHDLNRAALTSPVGRLAQSGSQTGKTREEAKQDALSAPTVRLAQKKSGREDGKGLEKDA